MYVYRRFVLLKSPLTPSCVVLLLRFVSFIVLYLSCNDKGRCFELVFFLPAHFFHLVPSRVLLIFVFNSDLLSPPFLQVRLEGVILGFDEVWLFLRFETSVHSISFVLTGACSS
jgi:hypothetical protein